MMTIYSNPDTNKLKQILKRPLFDAAKLHQTVGDILQVVQNQGDDALKNYTERFDKVTLSELQVTGEEIAAASQQVSDELKQAIQLAYANIERFHSAQKLPRTTIETMPGVECWQKSVAIEKVGLYIPGGTAPLFSAVLMLAIPAKIAGCQEIVLCTPPNKEGKVHPAILYTAHLTGVTQIYKLGGAQAIAAMAYGTETVPRVYKIFGPGNQYVTAAKQLVSQQGTAIDMPAGPSEVLVLAGAGARPEFVAADLLSQAEHGVDSQVVLITYDEAMATACREAVQEQLEQLPRKEIARKALANSPIIIVDNEQTATNIINEYAPEHLILSMDKATDFAEGIVNAGSVFLGHFTPESVGDYASGTNHTLPTNGFARAFSGINMDAYVKKITYQQLSPQGLQQLGPAVEIMAATEELQAHKLAVSIRLESLKTANK
jgi:histidinol dehydrogenase